MGLRDRLKSKVKGAIERFSGEASAEAPAVITPFERNLPPDENRKIVMAKLDRPKGKR